MRISGVAICRNAVRLDYPLRESLLSLLPLVDELVVGVGDCDDGTWEVVTGIGDDRVMPFRTTWDPARFDGGAVLADQTNLALSRCTGDWVIYLQSDEVLHEADIETVRARLHRYRDTPVEGLSFKYRHFYGSFGVVQDNWCAWYPREVRAVRTGRGVISVGDAAGFKVRSPDGLRRLVRADAGATVYHYGWARKPGAMAAKQEGAVRARGEPAVTSDSDPLSARGHLRRFQGTHPAVMSQRIVSADWTFDDGMDRQPARWARYLGLARGSPSTALRLAVSRGLLAWNSSVPWPKAR